MVLLAAYLLKGGIPFPRRGLSRFPMLKFEGQWWMGGAEKKFWGDFETKVFDGAVYTPWEPLREFLLSLPNDASGQLSKASRDT